MNRTKNHLAALAAFAMLLGTAGASQAASETCRVDLGLGACTTNWLRANATNHFVHVSVSSWQTFYLHDIDTHVIVYHGTNGIFGTEHTVTGLFGRYTGEINNLLTAALIGGHITITNT
jgi:hypothetical protein